ncbi:hypothetical protein QM637_10105 [Pantoea allii]|uniref:hypothetical protein n=1 Tax=Pantoea allii TaxID=574096 RepID=UPI001F4EA59F|nr:hypothetical protein [Pantoea allii]MCH9297427.1 hypothetical protein [Pantoea allii]MDJ0036189.1 hypothetical protein [Pantoea allii]
MQADFSHEISLANEFRYYLEDNGWCIYQLVCSGGQAHMSISFNDLGFNKTVYPDVIALKDHTIMLGEIKNYYCEADREKLLEVSLSEVAKKRVRKIISMRSGIEADKLDIIFNLIHSDSKSLPCYCAGQFIKSGGNFNFIEPIPQ